MKKLIVSGDVSRRVPTGVPGIDMDMHVLIHSRETKTISLSDSVMIAVPWSARGVHLHDRRGSQSTARSRPKLGSTKWNLKKNKSRAGCPNI